MELKNHFLSLLLCFAVLNSTQGCSGENAKQDSVPKFYGISLPYQLGHAAHTIKIEDTLLQEISGLGRMISPNALCAISDERGEIYILNTSEGLKIEKKVTFKDKGDFEGVECVGDTLYALQSNGKLYEITQWQSVTPNIQVYQTGIDKSHDLEGLGFDPQKNQLLLACKEDPIQSTKRQIWAFDRKTLQLLPEPVFSLDPTWINAAMSNEQPEKTKYFSPSGIAVHPIDGKIYVLSSAQRRLLVLDPTTNEVISILALDKKAFPQPEGITFEKNGDLWISSEGKKGSATLQLFSYQPQEKR